MSFPQVPENLSDAANTPEMLRALFNELNATIAAFRDEKPLAERDETGLAALRAAIEGRKAVKAELRSRTVKQLSDEAGDEDDIPEPEPVEEEEDETDDELAGDETEEVEEVETEVEPIPVPSGTSTGAQPVASAASNRASRIVVREEGVEGVRDMSNATWEELALAIHHTVERAGETDRKWPVAEIRRFSNAAATLDGDTLENWRKLNAPMTPDLTAALCGPMTEITTMARIPLDTSRSVTPGLPNYNADAANVRVWEAPMFSDTDFSDGVGQWTSTDDAAVTLTGGPRKGCFEIPCATALDYELYAVWSCIEVSNLMALSFPQLISIYQEMGLAHHSQLGDDLALAFIQAATAVDYKDGITASDSPDWGVTLRTLRTMMRARADYIQKERYVEGVMFDAWLPKSLRWFFVLDLMSRRQTTGTVPNITPAEVDALFNRAGFDVHWYQDPTFKLSATVGGFEVDVADRDLVIRTAPKGKFRFIDKGRLNVGVMGSGGFRDSSLVARNRFRVFFETFETVIDTMAAPAVDISILDACANGVQIDDVVLDCVGIEAP